MAVSDRSELPVNERHNLMRGQASLRTDSMAMIRKKFATWPADR